MDLVKYKDKETKQERLAVPLEYLFVFINTMEVNFPGEPAKVLAELKYNIMEELDMIQKPEGGTDEIKEDNRHDQENSKED